MNRLCVGLCLFLWLAQSNPLQAQTPRQGLFVEYSGATYRGLSLNYEYRLWQPFQWLHLRGAVGMGSFEEIYYDFQNYTVTGLLRLETLLGKKQTHFVLGGSALGPLNGGGFLPRPHFGVRHQRPWGLRLGAAIYMGRIIDYHSTLAGLSVGYGWNQWRKKYQNSKINE